MKVGFGLMVGVLAPGAAFGCACGCGIFEVGTSSMLPDGPGGQAYVEYAFQDQTQNWGDSSKAPAADNPDKRIRTDFVTPGLQYMVNKSWGYQVELPFAYREFATESNEKGNPVLITKWTALGDARIHGLYTGFSDDMSSGIDFGLKLPTGNSTENNKYGDVDRDSEIGSGSTDLLLGGFHRGNLINSWRLDWYGQAELDVPVLTRGDYRPGTELDAALGADYRGFGIGRANVSPLLQVLLSDRTKDYGAAANSPNSGFTRVVVSPGVEVHIHPVMVYADVEVPVFVHVNGDQLVPPLMFKLSMSYMF